ncbi:NAC domain-containing protein 60 [Camellia lanceoleosa]|uniref:NAC domain-containing protein 60 n=1 Tax=Camellia lanceoleosa TaxID=1840588 RepID=A0ACC0F3B9_9ERIC|nr:NAC domain-containing protein 60 [Camellia lanceoleosa]
MEGETPPLLLPPPPPPPATMSIADSSMFPGFRFTPTDEELISYYLKKKIQGSDKCVDVIPEVEICKFEPWDLPAKSVIPSENEWFYFSSRGRKYPNGSQSKRATESGYWKATGKERNVKSGSNLIGTKRTLVFHTGRAPKGERTEWIMHEYCMNGNPQDAMVVCRLRKNSEFRLNDNPRQGSLSRRHLSTENNNNNNFSLPEIGAELSGIFEGTSSHNSHSVEQQIDYGSESDQILPNECTQPGSSHQDCDDEEWYADILQDDIVDLDKSLLSPENSMDERSQQEVQANLSHVLPFQGTAPRRIKLRWPKLEKSQAEPREVEISNDRSIKKSWSPKCLLSLLSDRRVNRFSVSIFLVILTLLLLCLFMLGVPCQVKRFTYASLSWGK